MKYIDADALKIEIKHHIELMKNQPTRYAKARIDEANETLSVISSLQQEMWKPSEEQMEALSDAYVEASTFKMGDILESLYNDLQKLL